jgi:hypothetical protein
MKEQNRQAQIRFSVHSLAVLLLAMVATLAEAGLVAGRYRRKPAAVGTEVRRRADRTPAFRQRNRMGAH